MGKALELGKLGLEVAASSSHLYFAFLLFLCVPQV
jgi:hypothetical protein